MIMPGTTTFSTCGRDIHEPTTVGGAEGETHHHLVCFRDHVFSVRHVAGESSLKARNVLLRGGVGLRDVLIDHRSRLFLAH